jgi:hypothetical protein
VNSLGKDLLLCSETVPDNCRTTELHYAKSLKTKVYRVDIIGGVHASIHSDQGETVIFLETLSDSAQLFFLGSIFLLGGFAFRGIRSAVAQYRASLSPKPQSPA